MIQIEPWHPKWVSIDWGFEHNTAVLWHATIPAIDTEETQTPRRVATYRELVRNHLSPREIAAKTVFESKEFREDNDGRGRLARPDAIYLSPDAFAKRTDEDTIAEQMGNVFASFGWPRPTPADNDRVGGWMLLYEMLRTCEWVISDTCPRLIACIPSLVRDTEHPGKEEDVLKVDSNDKGEGGDDAADSARYGLKSHLKERTNKVPVSIRAAERVDKFHDPTQRAIEAKRFQIDERKANAPAYFKKRIGFARRQSRYSRHA